jgi:hypothetical protein
MDTNVPASPPASGAPARARQSRVRPLHEPSTLKPAPDGFGSILRPAISSGARARAKASTKGRASGLHSYSGGTQIRFRRRCYQASRLTYLLTQKEWSGVAAWQSEQHPRAAARGEPPWPRGKPPQRRGSGAPPAASADRDAANTATV